MTQPSIDNVALSSAEIDLIRNQRRHQEKATAFEWGTNAAADLVISWAEKAYGGAGEVSELQRNLAAAIRNLRYPWPK